MRVSFVLRSAEETCEMLMHCVKSKIGIFLCHARILENNVVNCIGINRKKSKITWSTASESIAKNFIGIDSENYETSIPRISLAVPQPSTHRALHFLALEFGWDPAFAMQYDRRY
jgi:hypothetical protein